MEAAKDVGTDRTVIWGAQGGDREPQCPLCRCTFNHIISDPLVVQVATVAEEFGREAAELRDRVSALESQLADARLAKRRADSDAADRANALTKVKVEADEKERALRSATADAAATADRLQRLAQAQAGYARIRQVLVRDRAAAAKAPEPPTAFVATTIDAVEGAEAPSWSERAVNVWSSSVAPLLSSSLSLSGRARPSPLPPRLADLDVVLTDEADFEVGERRGDRGSCRVWRARWRSRDRRTVALKLLRDGRWREAEVLRSLPAHRNIVSLEAIVTDTSGRRFMVLTPFVANDLHFLVAQRTLRHPGRVINQLVRAAYALARAGVAHRALRPSRVLVDKEETVVLVGFSSATRVGPRGESLEGTDDHDSLTTLLTCAPDYCAPELFATPTPGTVLDWRAVDRFALGAICTWLTDSLDASTNLRRLRPVFDALTALSPSARPQLDEVVLQLTGRDR